MYKKIWRTTMRRPRSPRPAPRSPTRSPVQPVPLPRPVRPPPPFRRPAPPRATRSLVQSLPPRPARLLRPFRPVQRPVQPPGPGPPRRSTSNRARDSSGGKPSSCSRLQIIKTCCLAFSNLNNKIEAAAAAAAKAAAASPVVVPPRVDQANVLLRNRYLKLSFSDKKSLRPVRGGPVRGHRPKTPTRPPRPSLLKNEYIYKFNSYFIVF